MPPTIWVVFLAKSHSRMSISACPQLFSTFASKESVPIRLLPSVPCQPVPNSAVVEKYYFREWNHPVSRCKVDFVNPHHLGFA